MSFFNNVISSLAAFFTLIFGPLVKSVDEIAAIENPVIVSEEIVSVEEKVIEDKESINVDVCTCISCPMHSYDKKSLYCRKNSFSSFDKQKMKDFFSQIKAKMEKIYSRKQSEKKSSEYS